jgi:cAMP-dependent protein kinase regulator
MKYGVGDYFGELALLNDEPRAASVLATSECKTVSIDRESFKVV